MKKLVVLTTNRADFGLLRPVIQKLRKKESLDVRTAVSGSHLSPEFGMTYREIEEAGIPIDRRIEILLSGDTPSAISKTMALAVMGFADYFEERKPDALLVLGDRYEAFSVCIAAVNARIPIIHPYDGETTEGAVDECYRHSITKMAMFHFTATEEFRQRVVQLGEDPSRVFLVGAMGVENALHFDPLNDAEFEKLTGINDERPLVMCTFHPVTLESDTAGLQIRKLLSAVEQFPGYFFLFTKANSDADGRIINQCIQDYVNTHENAVLVDSLGARGYLTGLRKASFVLGNSSSGLAEVPSFGIPTINIGDRQKGRIKAASVIDCAPETDAIIAAIHKAEDPDFRSVCSLRVNPYGDGNTSSAIADRIEELMKNDLNVKKSFYDMKAAKEL